MTRIHDALRRAGGVRPGRQSGSTAADLFVSPWADTGPVPSDGPVPKAAVIRPPAESPTRSETLPIVDSPRSLALRRTGDGGLGEAPRVAQVTGPMLPDRFSPEWSERLTVSPEVHPSLIEQFRRLAATLIHRHRADGLKTIMIASANPGDGKTLTALNLALVLSESYRDRVLLIDGDLRRPSIGGAIRHNAKDGLNDVVTALVDRPVALVRLTETLTVLPAGTPDADPLSGLTSTRMEELLAEAREKFDWVIIDSPPLGVTADASLLCAMVDTAILVVRAGGTPHEAVQHAVEALGRDKIHGVVLNGVEPHALGNGEYRYDSTRSD